MFNGDKVTVWEDEKVLEIGGGDSCTIRQMCVMPLNCVLNSGKGGNFYVIYIWDAILKMK